MNKSSTQRNIELLSHIAQRLEELCDEVIFVGGCVTGLLITDKAAPDVRYTVDVDCIINIITKSGYYKLANKLREKGFKEMPIGDHPLCRWNCDGVYVDIMPVDSSVLGFSNKWYKEAAATAINSQISNEIKIQIISAPYFLATKIEAFKDRGRNDYLSSHDIEDIISLLDGRPVIVEDIALSSAELKQYLSTELLSFMQEDQFMQALPGHLNYSQESDSRRKIVENRMKAIIQSGDGNDFR